MPFPSSYSDANSNVKLENHAYLIWTFSSEVLRNFLDVLCRQNGVLLLAVIMLWILLLEVVALMSHVVAHIASAGM